MSVSRTTIVRSPGIVTWGGVTHYPLNEIGIDYAPDFDDIVAGLTGRIDQAKKDFKIPIKLRLWGAIENLSVLFPSGALTPVPGTSLCADSALVCWGKNGNRVTFHNAFISKLAGLYLGVDKDFWAADVEFMALIKTGANPEDAAAYFTRDSSAFTDTGFARTNFLRQRYTGVWGTIISSIEARDGWKISYDYDVQYDYSANYGTDNAYIGRNGLRIDATCIPAALAATVEAASFVQGRALGVLASGTAGTHSADLVISGSGSHAVTLKNAFCPKWAECFDIEKLRLQETTWRSTSVIATGARGAEGVIT